MTYPEWKKVFVDKTETVAEWKAGKNNSQNGVANSVKSGIMKSGSDAMVPENQRYGRNNQTLVNHTYIESGEYRRKFDKATSNKEVNKALYDSAKAALKHRSGTVFEDMYWINGNTGKIVLSVLDSDVDRGIVYTDKIESTIRKYNDIVTLHTHPGSMPPSASDFNSCYTHGYTMGFIACHNGKVFGYTSNEMINPRLMEAYAEEFMKYGSDEFNAQIMAIEKMSEMYDIKMWEVQ